MILADTSIWIDHFRSDNDVLAQRLDAWEVRCHPWVVGELLLGLLPRREESLRLVRNLPEAIVASADEIALFVDRHGIIGRGIGFVDAALLTATALTPDTWLWTRDRRLHAAAAELGLAARH